MSVSVPRARYFCRVKNDDFVAEFCVAGWADPDQQVHSPAPDGTTQVWRRRLEGDLMVFTPPDGYSGGPVGWLYDPRLQRGSAADRGVLEAELLRNRVSGCMDPP